MQDILCRMYDSANMKKEKGSEINTFVCMRNYGLYSKVPPAEILPHVVEGGIPRNVGMAGHSFSLLTLALFI